MQKFKLIDYQCLTDFTDIDLSVKEAILAKCLDCCCWDYKEVRECGIKTCSLKKYKDKWFKIPRKVNENDKRRLNTFGR